MHWTAGFGFCSISSVIGPPPVMRAVRRFLRMDPAKRLKLLTLAHLILGGIFAAAWGMQSVVFGLVLSDFIRSNAVGKIGFVSSIAYALLGLLWLVVGILLRSGASSGLIRALSLVGVLFLPFGPILSVPALLYARERA
jgi:hypothetical protein